MKTFHADSSTPTVSNPVRGFASSVGLHPAIAFLALAVDFMLYPLDVVSLGTDLPFSVAVSCAVGFLAFKGQQAWYGDTRDSAMTKAGILALLTAIPGPIPSVLYVPAGIIGMWRKRS